MQNSRGDIYLIVAGSIGMGEALERSGALLKLGEAILELSSGASSWIILIALYVLNLTLSLFLTGSATCILTIPLAFEAAAKTGLPEKLFVMTIMFACSQELLMPFA